MNRKKVAIILDELSVGGIPKAGISFMKQLTEYCEVTLVLRNETGEFMKQIPKRVNVKVLRSNNAAYGIKQLLYSKRYVKATVSGIKYFMVAYVSKRWVKANVLSSYFNGYIDNDSYDIAIAYHGMSISQLTRVLFGINAKKKIAWIHGNHPFTGQHKEDANKVYKMFDHIFCVSEATKEKFLKDFPDVMNNTEVYYNLFEVEEIVKKSQLYIPEEFNDTHINLVTVGRISPEKGQEMIPNIMMTLLEFRENIHWYIVGDGIDKNRVENMVRSAKLEDKIHFLGAKTNPYPYMLNADVYVQPSYTEGHPLTIFEAAILGKVIVATDVGGTKEQLRPDKDVILVKSDAEAISCGIMRAIDNVELINEITKNLSGRDFSNKKEVHKILNWIE